MSSNGVQHIHESPLFQYCNHVSDCSMQYAISTEHPETSVLSLPPPPYTPPPLSASCARLYEPLRKDFGSAEK